jgi:hypothetical protein
MSALLEGWRAAINAAVPITATMIARSMVREPIVIVSRPPRRDAERLAGFDRAGFPAFLIRSDILFSEIRCCPQSAESKYRMDRAVFLVFFTRTDILLIAFRGDLARNSAKGVPRRARAGAS